MAATTFATTDIEIVACPLCGADTPEPSPYSQDPYRVVRCRSCLHWYLSPRPTAESAASFYSSDEYFSGGAAGYADYAQQEHSLRKTFRRLLRDLAPLGATGGRLLELGTGLGYFLDEARSYYAERYGIELSPKAADAAAELTGAPVHRGLEALEDGSKFDCIVALHVIEHVPAPVPFVKRLADLLMPEGTLVLAAPHMGSFWRHLMGRRWPSFKYPEHLSFFDADTLRRLFDATGFAAPRRLPYVHDFPLSEILAKLHLPSPSLARRLVVPLPATTICYAARRRLQPPTLEPRT